ncbi:hypothetical protein [Methanobrevibacter sp.]
MARYIRENKNSYTIVKNSKSYGKFKTLDDAMLVRDILMRHDWNPELLPEVMETNNQYIALAVIDEKIHLLAKSKDKPSAHLRGKLIKKLKRNPNNSKYGLNITRVFETFIIQKQIMGDEYVFGYYDNLKDAEFVRNHLLDNRWNVDTFAQIMYDGDEDNFKITDIIDDKIYIIDTYQKRSDIDLEKSYEMFLAKIAKHSHGLASHPYLDELTGRISELEEKYGVLAHDENWNLENVQNPLSDAIFNLTPWQKTVYDAVDESSFEDIKKSLIRYRSGNFDEKIMKNLNELIWQGLVEKREKNYYKV